MTPRFGAPRRAIAIAAITAALAGLPAAAGASVHVVEAEGDTLAAARQQAISSALQAQVQQLIVADRSVDDESILRDRVITTFNGFVDRFEELEVSRDGQMVRLKARVTVSESGIGNYLASAGLSGDPAQVDGQSLFAEANRQGLQQQSHQALVERSLAGYPSSAWELRLRSVQPLGDGKPGVRLLIDVRLNEDFRASLDGMGNYVATSHFPATDPTALGSRNPAWRQMSEPVLCVGTRTCHVLQDLDYLPGQGDQTMLFTPEYPRSLVLAFIDEAGRPIDLAEAGMAAIVGDGADADRSDGTGFGFDPSAPRCIAANIALGDRLVRDASRNHSSVKFAVVIPRTQLAVTVDVPLPPAALQRVRGVAGMVAYGGLQTHDGLLGRSVNGLSRSGNRSNYRFVTDLAATAGTFAAACGQASDTDRRLLPQG